MRNRDWLLMGLFIAAFPVFAQTPGKIGKPEEKKPAPNPMVVLTNTLVQVEQEIRESGTNAVARVRVEKLRQIKSLVEERLSINHDLMKSGAAGPEAKGLPDIPTLSDHTPPYPLELLDALRHARNTRDRALANMQILAEAAEGELDFARKQQHTREQEVRSLSENKDGIPDRQVRLEKLKLDARIAEQQAGLRQVRLRQIRQSIEVMKTDLSAVADQLKAVGLNVQFTQEQFYDIQLRIDQREASLKSQVAVTKLEIQQLESMPPGADFPAKRLGQLRREVEALDERLLRIPDRRLTWEHRYALFNRTVDEAKLAEWCDGARQQLTRLDRLLRLRRVQYDEAASAARDGLEEGEPSDPLKQRLATALDGVVAALQRDIELNQNLLDDHDLLYGKAPSATAAWGHVRRILKGIWMFEITAVDDRSITVKKVVYAILLILIGLKLARLFSLRLVNHLLSRFKVEESTGSSISTLLFYVLALIVMIIALGVANIPLTFFALLGGALAIGVGFGSQNIINNFISGLILLIERPIRRGDMVEVNATYGKIERVGLRCTQVRMFANIDILVPNSSFLENNVTNWTLTDDRVRAELYIGVVYGAATDRVKALMLQAGNEHEKILRAPAPEVMFMDFGDNALIFRMYLWVRMRSPSDRDRVLSDLRFRIDELFKAENLVIAFPQRDVHLDSLSPIEVRMVNSSTEEHANES